jgi:hypothetical protein
MTPEQTITAYRAAAKWLAEALADTSSSPSAAPGIVYDAVGEVGGPMTSVGEGIGYCANWHSKYSDQADGWRWITEAARLRLLLEALVLEQRPPNTTAARQGWPWHPEDQAELGALAREVLAATTATTSDVSPGSAMAHRTHP